jgi:hypothetical protein
MAAGFRFPPGNFVDWKQSNHSFQNLAASQFATANLAGADGFQAERMETERRPDGQVAQTAGGACQLQLATLAQAISKTKPVTPSNSHV